MERAPSRGDPWIGRWGRRAISIPLYVLAFVALAASSPLWVPVALVLDLATTPRTLARLRTLTFFALYLFYELLGVAAATGLWVVHLGGIVGGEPRWVRANAALQRVWTGALFRGASGLLGFRLELEPGSAEVGRGPLLLFVRHTSTADTILAAALVANPSGILLRYVLKRELLWDPCLDIVGRRLPNTFVDRSGSRRAAEIAAVAALAQDLGPRDGALIYPEGTRFSPAKLEAARVRLRSEGRPDLAAIAEGFRHVLPPRLGGPLALLEAAPGVDVVVLDHAGFEAAASFRSLWAGGLVGKTVRARLRRIPADRIPIEDRERWLFETWRDTDDWVGRHTTNAEAPR